MVQSGCGTGKCPPDLCGATAPALLLKTGSPLAAFTPAKPPDSQLQAASTVTPCPGPGSVMQPGLNKHIMRCLLSPGCRVCPATASLGYLLAYRAPGLWSSSKSVCTQPRCFCKAFHRLWRLIRAGSSDTHSIQIPNGTES